jgi:predicted AlkP superfamily pyrophosphatase or phosphodiesterase
MTFAATAVVALLGLSAARPQTSVVLVSIDGLRPDYVLEADRHGLRVPELRKLVADGVHARVRGVLPTVTYPSHATLVTGASPARHGIYYNRPADPLGRNADGWYWYAEDLRADTLWDAAGRAGFRTANVDWPTTVGARIDFNIPQFWRSDSPNTSEESKLRRVLGTPGLLRDMEAASGPYPSGYAYDLAADRRRAEFSVSLMEKHKPRLHLAYFSGLDEEQHLTGPATPSVYSTLEALDSIVGQLRRAAEASLERPVFAVVSDHGFVRTDRFLGLNEALREAGLLLLDARGRVTHWRAWAWGTGGTAAVILRDPNDVATRDLVRGILDGLSGLPESGIARVYTNEEARAAGGFPDAAFVVSLRPGTRLSGEMLGRVTGPAIPGGDHGFGPDEPDMDASFFAAGPGLPAGRDLGRIDMRDIAPTLAARLGVKLRDAEGRDLLPE